MHTTPYTEPATPDTGDDLVHACRLHPFEDQACHAKCRTYCGQPLGDPSDVVYVVVDETTPNFCVVCESMHTARYGPGR